MFVTAPELLHNVIDYLQKLAGSDDPKGYSSVARTAIGIHQQVSAARIKK